jgi:hypothetical protein
VERSRSVAGVRDSGRFRDFSARLIWAGHSDGSQGGLSNQIVRDANSLCYVRQPGNHRHGRQIVDTALVAAPKQRTAAIRTAHPSECKTRPATLRRKDDAIGRSGSARHRCKSAGSPTISRRIVKSSSSAPQQPKIRVDRIVKLPASAPSGVQALRASIPSSKLPAQRGRSPSRDRLTLAAQRYRIPDEQLRYDHASRVHDNG